MGYSLVIIDIHMQVMDGYEVSKRLFALEQQQQDMPHPLTVLAITSKIHPASLP